MADPADGGTVGPTEKDGRHISLSHCIYPATTHLRYNGLSMPNPAPSWTQPEFPPLLNEPLDPGWDLGVAAQYTVLFHFREMLAQRQVVWDNAELEGVHQIRVATRRTRTALQTLRPLWGGPEPKRFEKYLVKFATAFGEARDLDVMILYFEELLAGAEGERAAAYRWLLERNRHKRAHLQPTLEKVLLDMEESAFIIAFVTYFSHEPCNLWALGAQHG